MRLAEETGSARGWDEDVPLYKRSRNRHAARNHIAVVPTTFCVIEAVRMIVEPFAGVGFGPHGENRVLAVAHEAGCCGVGIDDHLSLRVLSNALMNPNVGAVVTVSLGCGAYCSTLGRAGTASHNGKLVEITKGRHRPQEVVVQGEGGRLKAVEDGRNIVARLIKELGGEPRYDAPLSSLMVGVLNGSSDPTSGLFCNPATGAFCDEHLAAGGRVAFSQTTETLGAERLLVERTEPGRVRDKVTNLLTASTMLRLAVEREGVETEPTLGNIRSGISTLAEKSIGTVFKIGSNLDSKIVDVIPHGKTAGSRPGLYFVDGPGQDVLCMSGLVAAGASLLLFTTGKGAPTGSPFAPTIKLTANRTTYEHMRDVIDVYIPVEEVLDGRKSLKRAALDAIVPYVRDVASGRARTSAERFGQNDFQIRRLWLTE
jgi:altronate dehydratase large subunit